MSDDLEKLRREIDALDDRLLEVLSDRARVVHRVGELKGFKAAYRPEREAAILRRMTDRNPGPLPAERVTALFREVISACRSLEERIRVAYLGPEGTFTEQAAIKHFGSSVDGVPYASVEEVFRACETGDAGFAVAALENSTEGQVGRNHDLLLHTPLRICGEVELRVQQNLLTRESTLEQVIRVYGHSQSLAQCNEWLIRNLPKVERIPVASNAEAARRAAAESGAAALAGESAARKYDLRIHARAVADDPNNTTRFVVLGHQDSAPSGRDRTSLALSVENKPGAVHALLTPLALNNVSMTRIESRPSRGTRTSLWEYVFFIDVEGHRSDPKVAAALKELSEMAPFLKVLGSYPVAVP
jgi:chorismate mutase/prephenate dehydratase